MPTSVSIMFKANRDNRSEIIVLLNIDHFQQIVFKAACKGREKVNHTKQSKHSDASCH